MASKAIGFLNFKFAADLSGFDRAMKKAEKNLKKFGKSVAKAGKSMTMGLTLPLVALGKVSIDAFDAQQKAIAQVEAGLKSTGNQVGITSEKLQEMAADLQKTTLFGDEEILKDATAQLLTFTNITGTEFAKTQEIVLDLATRLDGDLKSSAIMLGKALNDPVANLSALSRAGIQFSTEQKETINSLVETNDLAGAQTIILAELEKQYGGSAEAAALAGTGPIKQLQNELGDLSEQIGERLIPFVKDFVTWIKGLAEKFDGLSESTKDNIVKWGLILAAIGPVLIIIGKMSVGISYLIPLMAKLGKLALANPYLLLAAAIIGVGVALNKYAEATSGVLDKKAALVDIERKAAASIAPQLTSIQRLVAVYDSENTSLDDKKKALQELKKLYPKYYGEIDETTFSTGTLANATQNLTKSLMDKARLVAYSEGIEKVTASIIDLELKGATTGKIWTEKLLNNTSMAGDHWRSLMTKLDAGELKEQKQLLKLYTDEFLKLSEVMGTDVIPQVERVTHNISDLGEESEDATDKVKKVSKSTVNLTDDTKGLLDELTKIPEISPSIAKAWDEVFPNESQFGKVDRFFERMREDMTFMFGDLDELGDNLQLQLDGMLQIFDAYQKKMRTKIENENKIKEQEIDSNYEKEKAAIENSLMSEEQKSKLIEDLDTKTQNAKVTLEEQTEKKLAVLKRREAIKEKAMAIANIIMNTAQAIMKTLGKAGFFGIPLTFIVAAMGAAQLAIVASTPLPLAEGGLVTGPTTALIGEGVGTSISNPEVVAPLDRLKSMIGGGNQNITVTGKLIGSDIYLSNATTGTNRFRTV